MENLNKLNQKWMNDDDDSEADKSSCIRQRAIQKSMKIREAKASSLIKAQVY